MLKRPDFPHVFDSTMISALRSCQTKMYYQYMQHFKSNYESVHLHAGASFAKGLEVARDSFYVKGEDKEVAESKGLHALLVAYGDFEPPENSNKSLDRMLGAYEFFMDQYPLGDCGYVPVKFADGKHGIEFSFAEPLEIDHPTTGEPILFCGRADMIGEFADGVFLEDDKTTSSLGAQWASQWELRSQFTGYTWAAKRGLKLPVKGALIRGISILKTKYDTQQVLTYRSDWEIDRWLEQVKRDINKLIAAWKEGYYDFNLDYSCNEYGGCLFRDVCKSRDPEKWLEAGYTRRVWNPIDRVEMTPEEWDKSWVGEEVSLDSFIQ